MDALLQTQEELKKVLQLQQAMQREIDSIRARAYVTRGRSQVALADDTKQSMIVAVEDKCRRHCSIIYEQLNQERIKSGLSELLNPYNK